MPLWQRIMIVSDLLKIVIYLLWVMDTVLNFGKSVWLEPAIGLGYANNNMWDELYPDKNFVAGAVGLSGKYRMDDVAFINTFIIDGFVDLLSQSGKSRVKIGYLDQM